MRVYEASMNTGGISNNTLYEKFRHMKRTGTDAAGNSFADGGDSLKLSGEYQSKMTASMVTTKVGDKEVTFNNSTGAITWGGKRLDLKGIADPRVERNLVFQEDGAGNINVWRSGETTGYVLDGSTGKMKMTGDIPDSPAAARDADAAALIINNANLDDISAGTDSSDIIINRQNGAELDAGKGDDIIFNFAKQVTSLSAGAEGNDAIYSVGLTGANTLTVGGAGDGYLKLLGNTSKSTITMGKATNFIDAAGFTLNDVIIKDDAAGATSSGLIAKSVTGASTIGFEADYAALDLKLFDSTAAGGITFGAGVNSAVIDTLKGVNTNTAITSTGTDSFQFKTVTGGKIDASGANTGTSSVINITGSAKDSIFALGAGSNTLNAAGKTLTSVEISDAAEAVTSILAGSITGTAEKQSSITLAGNANDNATGNFSGIDVKGVINQTTIDAGSGAAGSVEVTVGSMKDSTLEMGGGKDTVIVNGAIVGSTIDLGKGVNSLTAMKGAKGQAITNTTITASGDDTDSLTTIIGGAYTAGEDDKIELGGPGSNHVTLNSVATGKGVTTKAVIDLSAGAADATQTLKILGKATNLEYIGSEGADNIIIEGALQGSTIGLGDGANALTVEKNGKGQAITNTSITAGGAATDSTTIKGGAFRAGEDGNTITLAGLGANSVTLGSIATAKGTDWATITLGGDTSEAAQTLTVAGAVSNLKYTAKAGTGGAGNVTINGALLNSEMIMGAGTNTVELGKSANKLTYTGGAGIDSITIEGALLNSAIGLGTGANELAAMKGTKGQAITNTTITASGDTTGDKNTITGGAFTAGAKEAGVQDISLLNKGENTVTLSSIAAVKGAKALFTLGQSASEAAQELNVGGKVSDLTYTGAAGVDSITIEGALLNSTLKLGKGENSVDVLKGDKRFAITNTSITDEGSTAADLTTIKGGAYTAGANNLITLAGLGENSVELASIAAKGDNATITLGGDGSTADQKLTVTGKVSDLTYVGSDGNDKLALQGAVLNSTIGLGAGTNEVKVHADGDVTKTFAITDTNIEATGATTVIGGAFTAAKGNAKIDLQGADEDKNIVTLGSIVGKGDNRVAVTLGTTAIATADQTLTVNGATSNLDYTGSKLGKDVLNLYGAVSNSKLNMGAGEDSKIDSLNATDSDADPRKGYALNNVDISAGIGSTINMGVFTPARGSKNSVTIGVEGPINIWA